MDPKSKLKFALFLVAVLALVVATSVSVAAPADDLVITGIIDGPLTGGVPKAVELYAINAIPDLSIYGIGLANNGGGSDGIEFDFPADSVPAGSCIYVATDAASFNTFFGFDPSYTDGDATNNNGDDAFELFTNGTVSDVFGDINTDGTGQAWEHLDGWAYRNAGTGPDGSTFTIGNWSFSGVDALDGETSNATAATPFPLGTYSPCTVFTPPPPPPPPTNWIINEINADPDSTAGDANGDGTAHFGDDEFVEIVNNSGSATDISGWTVSDGFAVRHTFPSGTVVPDSCSVVVFGGGTPTGTFGNSAVQTASTGSLGLNNGGDTVTLNDGIIDQASHVYGSEGGDNQSLTRDPDITGADPLVKHTTATGSGGALFSPGTLIDGSQFPGCPISVFIHEVQGDGSASPLVGTTVVIEGIVVGDFQDDVGANGDLNGFFVQEEDADADTDPETSEGIFVFQGSNPTVDVAIGDLVRVEGPVSEFFGLTQITSFSGVSVIGTGSPPTAATVTLPVGDVSDFESFEGMAVTFPQQLVIAEYFNFDRFNEIVLATERPFQPTAIFEPGSTEAADLADLNARSRITLDDGRTSQNPDPAIHPNGLDFTLSNTFRGGDTVQNATGVLDYSFGLYRIQPTTGADYVAQNPRPIQPDDVGGNLKVASFNVLNYFLTLDYSTGDPRDNQCGPLNDQECRGADANQPDEFDRQSAKIQSALIDIEADVFGLIEMENSTGVEPLQDIVAKLNAHFGAGTYAYIDTGTIGDDAIGDVIKVGIIYKTASVSPLGDFAILDKSVDPRFDDTRSRPVLAQTFEDNNTGGVFTVAVNHLKSKSSGCGLGDDDPEQGNCNLTRTLAAQAMVDWLATDPTNSGDPDFLITGDLNAYDKEDPIDAVLEGSDDSLGTGDDYTDLIAQYQGEYAYSYVFSGQFGYLDHALSNTTLTEQATGVTEWHINADEPDILDYDTSFKQDAQDALYEPNAFRSSDHDPVVVGLDLNGSPVCSEAMPSLELLWPPKHQFVAIDVLGVTDPEGDPFTINIDAIFQDEPVDDSGDGATAPDARGIGTSTAEVRAERDGRGNGRVYHISFTASDAYGSCSGTIQVGVPKSDNGNPPVDDGPLYDSTEALLERLKLQ